ncbi:MAG: YdcF family protein [Cyanobacteria bacterium P01_E01_bin.42]
MKPPKWLQRLGQIFLGLFLLLSIALSWQLYRAASQPVEALLVLGGSIRREIYVAELSRDYPDAKILISNGSRSPCIWLIFDRAKASMENVCLERCARNTFRNFYYTTPILREWGVKHIKLITSKTHLPRAIWMARIHLGIHKIWVDLDIAEEKGVPGNREFWLKTVLDVTRSGAWAIASLVLPPPKCDRVRTLTEVNMQAWLEKGFKCEYQANLDKIIKQLQERQKSLNP